MAVPARVGVLRAHLVADVAAHFQHARHPAQPDLVILSLQPPHLLARIGGQQTTAAMAGD